MSVSDGDLPVPTQPDTEQANATPLVADEPVAAQPGATAPPAAFAPQPFTPIPVQVTPSPSTLAWQEFWAGARQPVPMVVLVAVLPIFAFGILTGRFHSGLGTALAAALVWLPAVPTFIRDRRWSDLGLAAASVLAASVIAWRDSVWVTAVALTVAVGAAIVAAMGSRTVIGILISPFMWAATAVRAIPWLIRGRRPAGQGGFNWGTALATLLALGLVGIFAALFAAADPAFAQLLPSLRLRSLPKQLVEATFWTSIMLVISHAALSLPPGRNITIGSSTRASVLNWMIPIVSVTVVVWLFVVLQLSTARELVLQGTHTFADSAHQGFGQLLVATLLTPIIATVAARYAPRDTKPHRLATTVTLVVFLIGMVGVVVSALHRMQLYVGAYGLSELRIMAGWLEIVLGGGLLLGIGAAIWWRGQWLPRAAVALATLAVVALAGWNPDAQIVRYNYAATTEIDTYYLRTLCADAVPAVNELPEPLRQNILQDMTWRTTNSWVEWNYSRAQADIIVENNLPN